MRAKQPDEAADLGDARDPREDLVLDLRDDLLRDAVEDEEGLAFDRPDRLT